MFLSPSEQEKLLIYVAADIAQRRKSKGLLLNYPEAVALITVALLECARENRPVSECMEHGRTILTRDQVMPEVPELLPLVQVEATFADGTKLISCHNPIA
ncbi:MAG: urease subunit gamma [Firmicutes bacterium]|nr:urease subunit gamma [Bacillota bacterium]